MVNTIRMVKGAVCRAYSVSNADDWQRHRQELSSGLHYATPPAASYALGKPSRPCCGVQMLDPGSQGYAEGSIGCVHTSLQDQTVRSYLITRVSVVSLHGVPLI